MLDHPSIVRKLIIRSVIWTVLTALLLFLPAGTLNWPEGWIYLLLVCGLGLVSGLIIAKHDPALVNERLAPPVQRTQEGWDKILLSVFFALWLVQYVVAGLDAERYHLSDMPTWLKAAGAVSLLFGLYVFHIVMRANTFAAPVVKIQVERKQHVISTGPYAVVRHPMYGGAVALILGTGLLLGSWWALGLGCVLVLLLAYRAVLEEKTLTRELEGYAAYAQRIRYRMIPGIY